MPAGVSVGTFTLSARTMMWSPICTPVVADDASVTEVACCGVPADIGLRMTRLPVALAPLAVGELPVAWRAFVAILTKDLLERKKTSSLPFALLIK